MTKFFDSNFIEEISEVSCLLEEVEIKKYFKFGIVPIKKSK